MAGATEAMASSPLPTPPPRIKEAEGGPRLRLGQLVIPPTPPQVRLGVLFGEDNLGAKEGKSSVPSTMADIPF